MPLLHKTVDAERAHYYAVKMAKFNFLSSSNMTRKEYPELECDIFGKHFYNPIGIAAGFDKNGEAIEGLRQSGLGFIEIGSVTPLPQPGNDRPRVFRLVEDKALINRYGFNIKSAGSTVPLGINLGKNKTSTNAANDYEIGVNYLAQNCDYLVINVSSPNTPGLRALQSKKELEKIMKTVSSSLARAVPCEQDRPKMLLKITSDLIESELKDIAQLCLDKRNGIDGLIISNTTIQRPSCLASDPSVVQQTGGLSGEPLKEMSTECIRRMHKLTSGKLPIIGCGGVSSGRDAYEKILAGASLVQFYTALVYQGFPVIGRIKRELTECLHKDGFTNVQQAVGKANQINK
uniref:Dihydroorotate dehydrogenase (quinone), mitochondrial n=1 Tax=Ditylenchus dipsaci TaxID=166011 RepID=A0A915EKM2_9BILA